MTALGASAVAIAAIGYAGWQTAQTTAERTARRDAAEYGEQAALVGLAPHINDSLLRGDRDSIDQLDSVWLSFMRQSRAVRVKIWRNDGTIVWSDDRRVIGEQFAFDADELELLRNPGAVAGITDLSDDENRFDRLGSAKLVEVYVGIRTENGTPALVESYYPVEIIHDRAAELRRAFLPLLLGGMLALVGIGAVLACFLLRRLRGIGAEREEYRLRAVTSMDDERRRLAAIVHDRAVQDLIGVSLALNAEADQAPEPLNERIKALAGLTRTSVRDLRQLLDTIYPVEVPEGGWRHGIDDLVQRLRDRRVEVHVESDRVELAPAQELLTLRVAREALANALAHASATDVRVRLESINDRLLLEISDDGCGFSSTDLERRRQRGHFGLQLLEDATRESGDILLIDSAPGRGTVVRLEMQVG